MQLGPGYFKILAGVLQAKTLAPYQSIDGNDERLVIQIEQKSRRVGPTYITDIDFTEDLAFPITKIIKPNERSCPVLKKKLPK